MPALIEAEPDAAGAADLLAVHPVELLERLPHVAWAHPDSLVPDTHLHGLAVEEGDTGLGVQAGSLGGGDRERGRLDCRRAGAAQQVRQLRGAEVPVAAPTRGP